MPHTHLPCQYHSTNDPYSSPLSVSFHQCSILISPVSTIPPMTHNHLPCQYHSPTAPHSSPLSVSFHQCPTLISPASVIIPIFHTQLPCQYHSPNAPHLSPLSVLFHQCSTLIQSTINHAIQSCNLTVSRILTLKTEITILNNQRITVSNDKRSTGNKTAIDYFISNYSN